MRITMQLKAKELKTTPNCNCPAVAQMRDRGLRAIHSVCEKADNKAAVVLLGSYR